MDNGLIRWFSYQRNQRASITGEMLKLKAEKLGKLQNTNFTCSRGWIDRFKKRYNIVAGKIHGEAASVSKQTVSSWIKDIWPNLRRGYEDVDIFNADETGLFYRVTPDKTLKYQGEKCVGGKHSKERITVLVCANMTGSEKRKLLVVGHSRTPRCFKNCNQLPVSYASNKSAWMTSVLFENELRQWDKELKNKNRNFLLMVDNCPAHPHIENLKFIKLVFLPPCTTAILQPMDQGVIYCLKSHYKRILLTRLFNCLENKENLNISLLDAIVMINTAWTRVTSKTIENCFRHAGFLHNALFDEDDDLPLSQWILKYAGDEDDDNLPLSTWIDRNNINNPFNNEDLTKYTNVDSELITTEAPSDAELITNSFEDDLQEVMEDSDMEENAARLPTNGEVYNALNVLSTYITFTDVDHSIKDMFNLLQSKIEKDMLTKKSTQLKITKKYEKY